ncbi:MAG: hypothetical protein ACM3SR_07895 [Ignavibacteriales bacterium]
MGKALNDAHDIRQVGDYGVGLVINEGEAKGMLKSAKDFVNEIMSYLEKEIK